MSLPTVIQRPRTVAYEKRPSLRGHGRRAAASDRSQGRRDQRSRAAERLPGPGRWFAWLQRLGQSRLEWQPELREVWPAGWLKPSEREQSWKLWQSRRLQQVVSPQEGRSVGAPLFLSADYRVRGDSVGAAGDPPRRGEARSSGVATSTWSALTPSSAAILRRAASAIAAGPEPSNSSQGNSFTRR